MYTDSCRRSRLTRGRSGEQINHVNGQIVMFSQYVLAHVAFHFATIFAVRALKARLETTLVSQVSVQVPLPIKRLVAIRTWTNEYRIPHFRRSALRRSASFPAWPPISLGT